MNTRSFIAALSALMLLGCTSQIEPELNISTPLSIELDRQNPSSSVSFTTNCAWTATTSESWLSVSPSSGDASDDPVTVTVSATPNDTYDDRTATVTIMADDLSQTITVVQAARQNLIVATKSFELASDETSFEVEVQANVQYDVSISGKWIKQIGTKGLTTKTLTFSVSQNNSYESRTGTVTVTPKGSDLDPQVINVTQAQIDAILLEDSMFDMPYGGGEIEVRVSSNVDFEVQSAAEWIHYIGTRALSNSVIRFKIDENLSDDIREGSISITQNNGTAKNTVTVRQVAKTILQAEQNVEVPEEGGSVEVDIRYNTDFTVELDYEAQKWLTYVQTRAASEGKLQFIATPNDVSDIRTGTVTIRNNNDWDENPVTISFKQASKVRRLLMEFYNAMDGRNWTHNDNWGTDEPLYKWYGVVWDMENGLDGLFIRQMGLKGGIPACIGELSGLKQFTLDFEPGVTGTLPQSFSKLVNLEYFFIQRTSMTSMPDVFADMTKLETVVINGNEQMTGPLPESLGRSDKLTEFHVVYNSFTGGLPSSWERLSGIMNVYYNCLSGKISNIFHSRETLREFVKRTNLWQRPGYGFDISDVDIPGCNQWVEGQVENLDGTLFSFDDVIKKNKYTAYVIWATWCPYSKVLMPALKSYYETYRQDGFEIIATSQMGSLSQEGAGLLWEDMEEYKNEVFDKGYDQWYNFCWPEDADSYLKSTPNAEVYDQNGNVVFSSFDDYPDPEKHRFGKIASSGLIPFLETLFGPAEPYDPYSSTDYSKDGQVITLQKATVGKGINIVFMGDAYTDKDMGTGGLYETVMKQAMEEFFAIEPYKTFRNRFNVYAVKVVSKNGRIGQGYETALDTRFGNGSYVEGDDDKCFEYALKVPGITNKEELLVNVLLNSNRHAGTAMLYAGLQSSVARLSTYANNPDMFGSLLLHESGGHGFAFLDDEYVTSNGEAPQSHIDYNNEVYSQYGWFANVDFTDDPSKIHWSSFLSDERYAGKVGIYEGASLYAHGAWKPTVNSMMNMDMGEFNAPSRWAIYQRIMKRSGEDCSWEKFLEYDEVNRNAPAQAPRKASADRRFEPGAPPVIRW